MKNMLPLPTSEHIPIVYEHADNLCLTMDQIFGDLEKEIINLKNINDPFRCKSNVLMLLARFLNASVQDTDTENVKRQRIKTAIQDNKLFGTWIQNKNFIDSICGGNAKILNILPLDDWMLLGDGGIADQIAPDSWTVLGGASADTEYGIRLWGDSSAWSKGKYQIDTDNDSLTPSQIEQLKNRLIDTIPIGMIIDIGYIFNGAFIKYFTIGGTYDTTF